MDNTLKDLYKLIYKIKNSKAKHYFLIYSPWNNCNDDLIETAEFITSKLSRTPLTIINLFELPLATLVFTALDFRKVNHVVNTPTLLEINKGSIRKVYSGLPQIKSFVKYYNPRQIRRVYKK